MSFSQPFLNLQARHKIMSKSEPSFGACMTQKIVQFEFSAANPQISQIFFCSSGTVRTKCMGKWRDMNIWNKCVTVLQL
jgi:hypothetical protein